MKEGFEESHRSFVVAFVAVFWALGLDGQPVAGFTSLVPGTVDALKLAGTRLYASSFAGVSALSSASGQMEAWDARMPPMRDLFATSDPFTYSPLGPLHFGFWDGMMEAWGIMRGLIKNPVVVTGHSLGAAHAAILAGIMVVNHVAPVRRVTFGEPRAGGVKLRDVIKDIPVRKEPSATAPVPPPPALSCRTRRDTRLTNTFGLPTFARACLQSSAFTISGACAF